ncbi:MAG: hypothetical protein WD055_03795 [Candidatus Dependentiae bacterium]
MKKALFILLITALASGSINALTITPPESLTEQEQVRLEQLQSNPNKTEKEWNEYFRLSNKKEQAKSWNADTYDYNPYKGSLPSLDN